ncbi:MAG: translation initiation factor IF-2, partial [Bacteroidota bacterium]
VNASINNEDAYFSLLEAFASDKETADRVKEKRAARTSDSKPEDEDAATADDAAEAPAEPEPVEAEAPAEPEPVEAEAPAEPEPVEEEAPAEPAPVEAEAPAEPEPVEEEAPAEPAPVAEAPVEETAPEPEAVEPAVEEATAPVAEPEVADATAEVPATEAPETDAPAEGVEVGEDGESLVSASRYKLTGTKVIGKIDLGEVDDSQPKKKRKRKRKRKNADDAVATKPDAAAKDKSGSTTDDKKSKSNTNNKKKKKGRKGPAVDQAEVDKAYQETLRNLEKGSGRQRQRRRRQRRDDAAEKRARDVARAEEEAQILRVTEFISTGELANLMDVGVNEVISLLFESGMMVSINQRLDADTITFVADDFGFEAEFITEFGTDDIELEEDKPEDLVDRAPVVTVMGHVDHGKTSLLDYLRSADVVGGEAGGITQHIGAYHVELADSRKITFLDTPGHEAFTAMRARGAKVTDVVILVVAADDSVMPQTIEAINHAKAAEVPIVVAINKIDKPDANTARVMQGLSDHSVLVEQYGGKVQCALVSAKTGEGIDELLEKVLLESDLLELKANPSRNANGIVIESRLDKGRGTVATVLIQNGTLSVGDAFVAGIFSGRVRAMFDERDQRVDGIGPALPALVLGINGAPEVGDQFIVLDEEREARGIAQKRQQIHREQSHRQRKHITLDEIGRRLALGDFRELNLIVKADVGGSVEALSDSLLKLSNEEVAVNIIHSGVGAITEGDVMLATASDAVIIGFQVRPSPGARAVAEREEIDIRMYSIIYDAIEDVRDALEGLLSPEESERITGGAEVRETFKVPKMGTVAGCYVTEGRIKRNDQIRLIRDGIVIYDGNLSSLRRFKDDVKEVVNGYECGIGMENYNDLKVGDLFEAYEIVETKRKLEV